MASPTWARESSPAPAGHDSTFNGGHPTLPEAPLEGGPEGLVLAVAHLDAEHLPLAAGGVALSLPRSGCPPPRSRPWRSPDCGPGHGCGVRRIEVEIGEAAELEGPAQEGLHLHVEALADAADLCLEMQLSQPSAATSSSTLRVETPET